jgi:Ca2+-binding EF-hand superfamily protein
MIVTPLFVPATSWLSSGQPLAFGPQQQQHQQVLNGSSRTPLHVASVSSTTSLSAFNGNGNAVEGGTSLSRATQLQYKSVVDSYLDDIKGVPALMSLVPGTQRVLNGKDWSMLQQFRVIRETSQICYPHLVQTQSTWGSVQDIQRRNKFVPLLSPVQHESFEAMFRLVDHDHDGHISIGDLAAVLDSVRLDENDNANGSRFSSPSSSQQDGATALALLSLEEFMGLAAEAEFYNLLLETFGGMDPKNTGYIQVDQVANMLEELTLALYNPKFDGAEIMTENACTAKIHEMIVGSQNKKGTEMAFNYEDFTKSLLGIKC